jgi:hypothetical protein
MEATFCETKAGFGYKICIDGKWMYASKRQLLDVIRQKGKACVFRSIEEDDED